MSREVADAGEREVVVYATGLVVCSVCASADMDADAVEAAVNAVSPTGISSEWQCSSDPVFATGEPQPGPCDRLPETRRHWLMEC
jgi:hypothetical protein